MANKLKELEKQMTSAQNYDDWKYYAEEHDRESGMEEWKSSEYSKIYDNEEIKLRLKALRSYRESGDDQGLLFTLNEGIHGNMGGMGNSKLYRKAKFGTKDLIVRYVDEIVQSILRIADKNNKKITKKDKIDFFKRASLCFGRSAIMLSGGGQLGNFHGGVLKALVDENLLPKVISGSSAGSLFAGIAGTKNDDELKDYLHEDKLHEMITKEAVIYKDIASKDQKVDVKDLEAIVENVIPDLTFQEAYEKSGRSINISIAPYGAQQKSRLLNAVASPNVMLRSAIMASCAVPGIFPAVTLLAKNKDGKTQEYLPSRQWVDGSMSNDIPTKRLARLYGVNHFIVSLTNPLVIPFVSDPNGHSDFMKPIHKIGTSILKETTQFNYSIAKRFFKVLPSKMTFAANTINSIVQQDYTGDINIIAETGLLRTSKILGALSQEELITLIYKGEKATWPKIEAIRITTKIGRTLDQVMEDYNIK